MLLRLLQTTAKLQVFEEDEKLVEGRQELAVVVQCLDLPISTSSHNHVGFQLLQGTYSIQCLVLWDQFLSDAKRPH